MKFIVAAVVAALFLVGGIFFFASGSDNATASVPRSTAVTSHKKANLSNLASGGKPKASSQEIKEQFRQQKKSQQEAKKNGGNPERLFSVAVSGKPFDFAEFKEDPSGYLSVVEPGRVWQTAQPGGDVSQIARVSPAYTRLANGESVVLQVRVEPTAPVTFTNFDQGLFANGLKSVTVRAGQDGIAKATFTSPGSVNARVRILAGSPVNSGQANFRIQLTKSS